jgi:hypothetical protein
MKERMKMKIMGKSYDETDALANVFLAEKNLKMRLDIADNVGENYYERKYMKKLNDINEKYKNYRRNQHGDSLSYNAIEQLKQMANEINALDQELDDELSSYYKEPQPRKKKSAKAKPKRKVIKKCKCK